LSHLSLSKNLLPRIAVAICILVPASAQNTESDYKLQLSGQSVSAAGYSIQLVELNGRAVVASADSGAFGEFSFQGIPAGAYVARLVDSGGHVLSQELINLDGVSHVVYVRAPSESERPQESSGGVVSKRQLLNPPSKAAVKSMMESEKYSKAGQFEKAAVALEKAIRLSPDFVQAHTNLGAQYIHLGQYEKGLAEARRAMEIAGPNSRDLVNIAIAELALHRYAEALSSAQSALGLDKGCLVAHFIVGTLLVSHPESLREGIRHLELAADTIPAAAQKLARSRQLLAGLQ